MAKMKSAGTITIIYEIPFMNDVGMATDWHKSLRTTVASLQMIWATFWPESVKCEKLSEKLLNDYYFTGILFILKKL